MSRFPAFLLSQAPDTQEQHREQDRLLSPLFAPRPSLLHLPLYYLPATQIHRRSAQSRKVTMHSHAHLPSLRCERRNVLRHRQPPGLLPQPFCAPTGPVVQAAGDRSCGKRAGTSPADAVVRETIVERQVHYQSSG